MLGCLKYFLDIQVTQSKGLVIAQQKYTFEICIEYLEKTGMIDYKSMDSHVDPKYKILAEQSEPFPDPKIYRRLTKKTYLSYYY